MPGKAKMNSSARKFVARTRFTHNGFFEQKPLRKISSPAAFIQDDTHSTQEITSQAVNLYFSTPKGGKNVLMTNQSSSSAQTILTSCNTSTITQSTISQTVLTLCDGSVIKALSGSPNLDITTDPSLKCINDKFKTQCGTSSSLLNDYTETVIPLVVFVIACYCIGKHCCQKKPRDDASVPLTPAAFFDEQERRQREERLGRGIGELLCKIL